MTIADSGFMMENGGCDLPLTPEEERRIVNELTKESERNLKEGSLFYVISNSWYKSWQSYVGLSKDESSSGNSSALPARPGPISNIDIIENGTDSSDPQIRRLLDEGVDYVLVPGEVWKRLVDWYKGGPALPRKMISQGLHSKNYSVEVYPLCLRLNDSSDESETIIRLSKQASVSELYAKVCALKVMQKEKARIWDYFNKQKGSLLVASSDKSLEELNLNMDQDILLEVDECSSSRFGMDSTGNEFALVPLEPSRSSVSIAKGPSLTNGHSPSSKFSLFPKHMGKSASNDVVDGDDAFGARKEEKGGLAGLQNLGNTCFMNSALQCLAHTPPIVDYFLQDYSDEINTDNPLGMHGELALAFGDLLRKLWSSGRTAVAPRVFKGKLARFAPQFSGYNQHDSQELLAFLLDGLHEDLNRVIQKPYIEAKDSDGRPDEEVADESWTYHKARNNSLIVDVCQGQYKSTLVCPLCQKISITFDPFMYLSLPLPSSVTRSITVTVFYSDGSRLPMPYTVTVPKDGSCRDLSAALATACCLNNDESLLIAEVYDYKIFRYFETSFESLSSIKDDDLIVAYRYTKKGSERVKLEVHHAWQEKSASESTIVGESKLSGAPLVTYISADALSGADIDIIVSQLLSPLQRVHSSTKAHNVKENGSLSASINESSDGVELMDTEPEDTSDKELTFKLFLTDQRCSNFKPLNAESVLNPSAVVRVLLEWTDSDYQVYDASYLKHIPVAYKTGFTAKKTRQEAISLFSCLEAFLAEEPLGPEDMWYCPHCKEHRQANKKLDLWRLPEILVFHLKRFTYSRYLKNKIDTYVNFPIHNLDLSKYVKNKDEQSYVYNLYAISNHYGGLGGGHYTAYAKLIDEEDKWYHFDDSHVSPVGESEIRTSAAYVLFYQRVKAGSNEQVAETSSSGSDS